MSRRALLALLASAPTGCVLYTEDPPPAPVLPAYQLIPRGNVAPLGSVAAVAWDGTRHWLITREEQGDYWTEDRLEVFSIDAETGETSAPIVLTNHWERPTGATWIHGKLWIHYDANSSGLVTTLDTVTGEEAAQFSVGWGMGDIDTDGTSLYLGDVSINSTIEIRDLANGAITDVRWSEAFQASLRGLAVVTPPGATTPEVWGGSWTNALEILVGDEHVAQAIFDIPPGSNLNPQLVFAGQRLTVLANNQLYFYDVVRPGPL